MSAWREHRESMLPLSPFPHDNDDGRREKRVGSGVEGGREVRGEKWLQEVEEEEEEEEEEVR